MSNKKLFWLAFIILSVCEFGQFAYSHNTQKDVELNNTILSPMQCDAKLSISLKSVNLILPASFLLPR